MSIGAVVRAAFDPRTAATAHDLVTQVAGIREDGTVEPIEVADGAHEFIDQALVRYDVKNHPLFTVPVAVADAADTAAIVADAIEVRVRTALTDRVLTAGELNDLAHYAAVEIARAVQEHRS